MSTLLGLTLIAVVVTICICMLSEGVGEYDGFPSMLIQIMWIPLAALWSVSWILGWLR